MHFCICSAGEMYCTIPRCFCGRTHNPVWSAAVLPSCPTHSGACGVTCKQGDETCVSGTCDCVPSELVKLLPA